MIKWNKNENSLDFGTNWYIQFLTYYKGIKGVWTLGVELNNDYRTTTLHINLLKFSILFGRSKV